MFSLRVLSVVMIVSALSCIDTVTSSQVKIPPCLGKYNHPYLVCKKGTGTYYNGGAGCGASETGSCCPEGVSGNNAPALPAQCIPA
ncbi:hypothetical protein PSTT_09767 [Puccinia striiformis]|uniref:CBM1 domain-containing protein n=1 Tax=Puccinia striiformis TaxID=27350 RepID=A0A2S4V6Z8_9BASI|nr:hypothetical protein PSTT_09767 [Puccinia striiformis]